MEAKDEQRGPSNDPLSPARVLTWLGIAVVGAMVLIACFPILVMGMYSVHQSFAASQPPPDPPSEAFVAEAEALEDELDAMLPSGVVQVTVGGTAAHPGCELVVESSRIEHDHLADVIERIDDPALPCGVVEVHVRERAATLLIRGAGPGVDADVIATMLMEVDGTISIEQDTARVTARVEPESVAEAMLEAAALVPSDGLAAVADGVEIDGRVDWGEQGPHALVVHSTAATAADDLADLAPLIPVLADVEAADAGDADIVVLRGDVDLVEAHVDLTLVGLGQGAAPAEVLEALRLEVQRVVDDLGFAGGVQVEP